MVALGGGKFLVIEQGAAPSGKVFNKLMLVELKGATDIAAAAFNATTSDLEKSSMGGGGCQWRRLDCRHAAEENPAAGLERHRLGGGKGGRPDPDR